MHGLCLLALLIATQIRRHTVNLAAHVSVLLVDRLVFGLVRRLHVPLESIFKPKIFRFILDLLELHRLSRDRLGSLNQMSLGLWDQPVGQRGRHIRVFL